MNPTLRVSLPPAPPLTGCIGGAQDYVRQRQDCRCWEVAGLQVVTVMNNIRVHKLYMNYMHHI